MFRSYVFQKRRLIAGATRSAADTHSFARREMRDTIAGGDGAGDAARALRNRTAVDAPEDEFDLCR